MNLDNFFFWDTIQLSSKQAHWFYDSNFSSFFLPQEINSGHPPFFGMFLAGLWMLFGKTLFVGHLFMLLTIWGAIFQSHKLGVRFVGHEKAFLFPLVLFCNPIFLGHSILVSPDNVLVFLMLLSLNSLHDAKWRWVGLSMVLLAMVSMRGMMLVFAFGIAEFLYRFWTNEKLGAKPLLKYLPAGICALAFFIAHYLRNNWLGFHNDSPWQESFGLVLIPEYFKNMGLIAWRMIDFGNIFIVAPIIITVGIYFQRMKIEKYQFLLCLFIALVLVFVLPLSAFKYLTAHRYFMPLYLVISFSFVMVMVELRLRKVLHGFLILLIFGNFWIYPRSISQGWDVSLAHQPIYSMLEEMNQYVESSEIAFNAIGTEFPLKSKSKYLFLEPDKPSFKEGQIGEDKYILYSKIINDFKEEDYDLLNKEYMLLHSINRYGIDLDLYEKR